MVWGIGCHGNGADFLRRARASTRCTAARCRPRPALKLTRPDLHGHRRDGRRRRLRPRHGPLHPHVPPQRRHDRHRPQQPDLRAHHRSGLPHDRPPDAAPSRRPAACSRSRSTRSASRSPRSATFVARGFAGDIDHLTRALQAGAHAQGLRARRRVPAVRDLEQAQHRSQWFRERVYKLEETGWDPTDRVGGLRAVADDASTS